MLINQKEKKKKKFGKGEGEYYNPLPTKRVQQILILNNDFHCFLIVLFDN